MLMMWLPTLAMAFGVWTGIKYNINIQNYKKEQKMKKTDKQMAIDYLTSAALVSNMKEIEIDDQKLTRSDQQAVTIDLINRALVLLDENSLIPFLKNIDAKKNRTDFLMNLVMRSFNFINNNEEFIDPNEEHESHNL
jgi:hypothetical protein